MRATNWLLTALAISASAVVAGTASAAPVDSCGGIDFSEGVSCEVVVSGGCTAQCTPINVDVQCSANLYVGCEGGCTAKADVSCTGTCQGSCTADCMANAQFDCNARCNAQCDGDATAKCSASANKAQCEASAKETCSANCDGSCSAQASADCNAQCQGCCTGQCTADAQFDCQINCQAMGYADCEASVTGGCEAQCQKPEGALFCNGQYVDTSNFSLDQCLQDLLAQYNIKADGYAYGTCDNNGCEGKAGGSVSCSVANVGGGDYALGSLAAMGALGMGLSLVQRRRAKKA